MPSWTTRRHFQCTAGQINPLLPSLLMVSGCFSSLVPQNHALQQAEQTCFSLIWFELQSEYVSHFLPLPPSCGHDRVWHDARTNPRSLCDSRLPAQPGPAGWDLSHHADWQAQIWRPPGVWDNAVTSALSGQPGEEAIGHQNGGIGHTEQMGTSHFKFR